MWVVGDAVIDGSETGTSFRQALYFKEIGFNLHDTMIYEKNGAAYPANEKSNRYSQVFEYMFILSKGKPTYSNLIKDQKNRWAGHATFGKSSTRKTNGELKQGKSFTVAEFGYRSNIWRYNNGKGYSTKDDNAYEHPAIFPELLVKDHIETWSVKGNIVYDPFTGSGTTPKVAKILERNYVGSEISSEYMPIIDKRVNRYELF